MEARVHVGAPTPLPACSMDGSDCLGRPAVARADRHLGMAGYTASVLDLCSAHSHSASHPFAKTKFGRCRTCTCGSHNGPCCSGLHPRGVPDLLSHLHTPQPRPRAGRPRTLFRYCFANCCCLPCLYIQCRSTSSCTGDHGNWWIV